MLLMCQYFRNVFSSLWMINFGIYTLFSIIYVRMYLSVLCKQDVLNSTFLLLFIWILFQSYTIEIGGEILLGMFIYTSFVVG